VSREYTGSSYPLDKKCPACGLLEVEYNGNYFCNSCDWGLAEGANVQPWLRSLIRLRRAQGRDTAWEEQYLTPSSRHELLRSLRVRRTRVAR
jgi:uncharacterized Zn finger protein (UPF0148 family)